MRPNYRVIEIDADGHVDEKYDCGFGISVLGFSNPQSQ
jgi:hypothetical protein